MSERVWDRSRNRYGLWDGVERLASIGKELHKNTWFWCIDIPPYTCGKAGTSKNAKRDAEAALDKAIRSRS